MTVISAVELDDEIPAGGGARNAKGAHRGFRPAVDEPDPLDRRHPHPDELRQPHLARARDAKRASRLGGAVDRLDDAAIGVAEQQRTERADVVDVSPPRLIPDHRALATHEHGWLPPNRAVGANGAVHAAREEVRRDRHSAPSRRVIDSIGLWIPVRMGVSRTVERRLSVPRSSRTRSPNAARSSVS